MHTTVITSQSDQSTTEPIKTIVVDIDGTIADCTHRLHYITTKPKRYDLFHQYDSVIKDEPITPMIDLLKVLVYGAKKAGIDVVMVTGRPERTRAATQEWMDVHCGVIPRIYMRADKDHRPDIEVKTDIYHYLMDQEHREIILAIDDRTRVVDMWYKLGVCVLQKIGEQNDY